MPDITPAKVPDALVNCRVDPPLTTEPVLAPDRLISDLAPLSVKVPLSITLLAAARVPVEPRVSELPLLMVTAPVMLLAARVEMMPAPAMVRPPLPEITAALVSANVPVLSDKVLPLLTVMVSANDAIAAVTAKVPPPRTTPPAPVPRLFTAEIDNVPPSTVVAPV